MAVSFSSDTIKRTTTQWSDFPRNIDLDPELNGRHEPRTEEEIRAFAADILANGQLTPVKIRKGDNGRPLLVFGHGRWEAVNWLNSNGHPEYRLQGTFEDLNDHEAFLQAISENRVRKDVSPIDDATNIKKLKQRFNMSIEDIAKVYFPLATTDADLKKAIHFVQQREALIGLAPEAEKAVRSGQIKITAAVKLSKLSKDAQRQRLKESEGRAVKGKDIAPPKSKQHTVKSLIQTMVKELDGGPGTIDDNEYEWLSISRKKFKKLVDLVGAR
jgi:ParB/RepB/Spo0J family partition protein